MTRICFYLISICICIAPLARAETSRFRTKKSDNEIRRRENGKTVIYKKRNVVDFDETLIEGEVKNPAEFYFVHRPAEKFGSLLSKRKNFHKEMLRDTVLIK